MCEPTTAAILIGASMASGAYGSYSAAKANNDALEYNAKMAERNAELSEIDARNIEAQGEKESRNYLKKVRALQGEQRSSLAAAGVEVGEGSAADVIEDTQTFGSLDAMTIRRNASMEAWGARMQGQNYLMEANLARMGKRSPKEAAFTSLLGGAGQVGGMAIMNSSRSSSGSSGGYKSTRTQAGSGYNKTQMA